MRISVFRETLPNRRLSDLQKMKAEHPSMTMGRWITHRAHGELPCLQMLMKTVLSRVAGDGNFSQWCGEIPRAHSNPDIPWPTYTGRSPECLPPLPSRANLGQATRGRVKSQGQLALGRVAHACARTPLAERRCVRDSEYR